MNKFWGLFLLIITLLSCTKKNNNFVENVHNDGIIEKTNTETFPFEGQEIISDENSFNVYIESNISNINSGDKFIISIHIKNISGTIQELDMNYFYNTSWYFDLYYTGENDDQLMSPIIYRHSEKTLSPPVILNPLQEYIFNVNAIFEYGEFVNRQNYYKGMAIIFDHDDICYPIERGKRIVKIIFRINDSLFVESNYIELTINNNTIN
jgi:hypothetical protein